jgi:hypothetical protein
LGFVRGNYRIVTWYSIPSPTAINKNRWYLNFNVTMKWQVRLYHKLIINKGEGEDLWVCYRHHKMCKLVDWSSCLSKFISYSHAF